MSESCRWFHPRENEFDRFRHESRAEELNWYEVGLRPSQTKSLVDTIVYRYHKWLWFNMKRPALTLQIISICPQGHNVITKGPRLQSQIGETIPSRLWLTFRGRLSQQQKKRLRGTSIASKGYLTSSALLSSSGSSKKKRKSGSATSRANRKDCIRP